MRFAPLAVVALMILPLLPGAAAATFDASFTPRSGNEWWIQVRVTANARIDGVDVRINDGSWKPLELKSWGDWAKSYHAPSGSIVEFRARSGAEQDVSGGHWWPSGEPVGTAPPPPPPPPSGSVTFTHGGGNEWWVEAKVSPAPSAVEAMDTNGAWTRLELKSWGEWAGSFRIESGHQVRFRANVGGAWHESCWFTHPAGAAQCDGTTSPPPPPPPPPSGLEASFTPRGGGEWWIQVKVTASERLVAVDTSVNGGSWRPLELKSWGDWAKSYHAPSGSTVAFRATGASGATATSGAYAWPSGTPVGGGGGGSPIAVRVDAAARVADVDQRLFCMNLADWNSADYHPSQNATFVAYLKALRPGILRWPAGHTSQEYRWERGAATGLESRTMTAAHVESYIRLAREVGAEPAIAVNIKTGTPEAAADLVRYVNVERGHGVRWWYLGNEPDLSDGKTSGPEDYAAKADRWADAMQAVDPNVRLVGGEVMTGAHVVGSNGRRDWMTIIARDAGHELDALGWHYYPLDSAQSDPGSSAYPTVAHLFQETASDWRPSGMSFVDEAFPHLRRTRDAYSPGSELWVTEIAEDSGRGGKEGIVDTMAGALWTADILGRLAAQDADVVCKFVFKSGSTHRFNLIDSELRPRPSYYVYWLLAREFGDEILRTTSADRTKVAAHAALRDDGSLAILLVNKGTSARDVTLDLAGFAPTSVRAYEIRGDAYDDRSVTVNGMSLTRSTVELAPNAPSQPWTSSVQVPATAVRLLIVS